MKNEPMPDQNPPMPDKEITPEELVLNRQMVRYLKQWVKSLLLTQARVAEQMGVSSGSFSKWLSGNQGMSVAQFQSLADLLGVSPQALLSPPGDKAAAKRMARLLSLATQVTDSDLDAIETLIGRKPPAPKKLSANEK